MSILIKGMDMPKKCMECPLALITNYYNADNKIYCRIDEYRCPWDAKKPECPCSEIPDPKIFAARMKIIKSKWSDDPEVAHCMGDGLMEELLEALGYGEAVKIFEEMEKWYA